MGVTSPQAHARLTWPVTPQLPANGSLWVALQVLGGGAFAELALTVDGVSAPLSVAERAAPPTGRHPGVPMPPGWSPTPGFGLYEVRPEAPLPLGARCRLTARTLAGHDGPPGVSAHEGPWSVRCATRPPSQVSHRGEPVLDVALAVAAAQAPGVASVSVRAGLPAPRPGAGPSSGPGAPPGPPHTVALTCSDATLVCWLRPEPAHRAVLAAGEHLLEGYGDPARVALRVWSWAGTRLASVDPPSS